MTAVAAHGLVRTFGSVRALAGVDLEVAVGEVVALLGHNGAGKTTLLRHLTGVLAPTEGRVRVLGCDPVADGVAVRQRTGVLPAGAGVDGALSGAANLRVVGDLWGLEPAESRRRAAALLEQFGLGDHADQRAETYSTGMRQRLALARVLLHEPELLLLDEPTAALDPVAARQVREVVAELARDGRRTVVLCTHNLAEAQELCDRVVVLRRGRVVAEGTPESLVAPLRGARLAVEVEPAQVAAAVEAVGALGLPATAAAGAVVVDEVARARVPAVVAALVGAGVDVYAVRPETPSLEDVYLALHDGAEVPS